MTNRSLNSRKVRTIYITKETQLDHIVIAEPR